MTNFLQGSQQNINFYLITTSLNIDPQHGTQGQEYYDFLKRVIQQKAEIIFENETIRKLDNLDASGFLTGHDATPRTIYQVLIGAARHSDSWTCELLTEAIDTFPRNQKQTPEDGEYSIDFIDSLENGMSILQSLALPGLQWIKNNNFFYSHLDPNVSFGEPGDVWFVTRDNEIELFYKPAFQWIKLFDFVTSLSPIGELFISDSEPSPLVNSWWLNTTGIVVRRFNSGINNWEAPAPITVSDIEPSGPALDDLWFKPFFGRLKLFRFDGIRFRPAMLSGFPVIDRDTNSAFVADPVKNNFVLECNDDALKGGVLCNLGISSMVKIFEEGVLVGEFDSVNFIGSAVTAVNNAGEGRADVTIITTAGGDTVLSFEDVVISNGQVIFTLPGNPQTVIEFSINGVECSAFTFSAFTKNITFDPIAANFALEIGDQIHVIFKE